MGSIEWSCWLGEPACWLARDAAHPKLCEPLAVAGPPCAFPACRRCLLRAKQQEGLKRAHSDQTHRACSSRAGVLQLAASPLTSPRATLARTSQLQAQACLGAAAEASWHKKGAGGRVGAPHGESPALPNAQPRGVIKTAAVAVEAPHRGGKDVAVAGAGGSEGVRSGGGGGSGAAEDASRVEDEGQSGSLRVGRHRSSTVAPAPAAAAAVDAPGGGSLPAGAAAGLPAPASPPPADCTLARVGGGNAASGVGVAAIVGASSSSSGSLAGRQQTAVPPAAGGRSSPPLRRAARTSGSRAGSSRALSGAGNGGGGEVLKHASAPQARRVSGSGAIAKAPHARSHSRLLSAGGASAGAGAAGRGRLPPPARARSPSQAAWLPGLPVGALAPDPATLSISALSDLHFLPSARGAPAGAQATAGLGGGGGGGGAEARAGGWGAGSEDGSSSGVTRASQNLEGFGPVA
jgi:hypothetical protein